MRLGAEITEMVEAVHERVQVSWHHDTWHVTARSFQSALDYTYARFEDPVVLSRRDHGRRRHRVTLEVTTDATRAADAPPLSELADQVAPPPPPAFDPVPAWPPVESDLPADLEAIFAHRRTAIAKLFPG